MPMSPPRLFLLVLAVSVIAFWTQSARSQPPSDSVSDPLPEGAILRLGTTQLRHAGYVMDLAFTPAGKELVSAGGDYHVTLGGFGWQVPDTDFLRVWERASGREHRQLDHGHSKTVRSIAFGRDGK